MDTRTRIIATVGPATDDPGILSQLIREGVDVFRLNFSHGSYEEHGRRIAAIKEAREATGSSCAILLDTKGPEIRANIVEGNAIDLAEGDALILVTDANACETLKDSSGNDIRCIIQICHDLRDHVEIGTRILLDDGKIELKVEDKTFIGVVCRVMNGGRLENRKSINVPGVSIPLPTISDQDRNDLLFGIEQGVDFVAASFVRSGESVREIRSFLRENGGADVGIIAKIENGDAVDDIDDIIKASDGIMVARGDLGVEMPAYEVPHLQKKIVSKCNRAHRPVITATQMLESMTFSPRPTRAEAADVANAIHDGTDCVMLSGETAVGSYPVETVQTMSLIIDSTERHIIESGGWRVREDAHTESLSHAVGAAAVQTAERIDAKCLICPTMTGRTARLMSSLRPPMPIYAVTPSMRTMRQMQIFWGVTSLFEEVQGTMRNVIDRAQKAVCTTGSLQVGDVAVLTCGDRFTSPMTRDANGKPEKFAPANVMYVLEIRDDDLIGMVAQYGEDALMTASFFDIR